MKFSREFYMLLAHINPAIYDVIFPKGPLQYISGSATRENHIGNYQTQGSVFGTDLSGELKLLAKLTWKMKNLAENLRAVVVQNRISRNQEEGSGSFISELIDDYCGNGTVFPFPPKPHWIDERVSIEEKVGAAILFSQAASALERTEIGKVLSEGADKVLNSAMEQLTHSESTVSRSTFSNIAITG